MHRLHRRNGIRVPLGEGAQFIAELLAAAAQHLRDAEIAGGEACEGAVAPPVVSVGRSVLVGVHAAVDTHANVACGHRPDLALLQFERDEPLRRIDCGDDACARRRPTVADGYVHAVVAQFGNFQKASQRETLQLGRARRVDPPAHARKPRSVVAQRERSADVDGLSGS